MNNKIDFHMHSNISNDGEFTPRRIIELCHENGLKSVAIADHNSVRAIKEAKVAAKELNIELITAIELDCHFEGTNLHLLGYGIDENFKEYEINEKNIIEQELVASKRRLELVKSLGIEFEESEIFKLATDGIVTGEMIAEVALEDKRNDNNELLKPYREGEYRSDNPYVNFYWDFCSQGKPAFVEIKYITLKEAISLVKISGGISVFAHPGASIKEDIEKLEGIIACGIDGIEVYSSYHSPETIAFYKEQAEKFNLIKTMGSDFHGKIKPAIKLGNMKCEEEEDIYQKLKVSLSKQD